MTAQKNMKQEDIVEMGINMLLDTYKRGYEDGYKDALSYKRKRSTTKKTIKGAVKK